jgi:hypothetical protein
MIHTRRYLGTLSSTLLLATLVACVTVSVHELPPAGYSIAGVWELNAALSADTDKSLAAVQPKPRSGPGSGRFGQAAPEVINDPTTDLPPIDTSPLGSRKRSDSATYGNGGQNNIYVPPLDFQINALLGGQWLVIRQTDTEVDIANAAESRSFTPGEKSVVSVPSGVADQVTGWSGRDYVVALTPQIGPAVKETYTLTPDGRQLRVVINVGSEGRNKPLKVTRVYDHSTRDPATLRQTLQQYLPPTER